METLVEDVQEETVNFEAMVQGQIPFPASPLPSKDNKQGGQAPNTPAASLNTSTSIPSAATMPLSGEKKTLFHHGFNKLQEQFKQVSTKVSSASKKNFAVDPYPSQQAQDDYVQKHGEEKFVAGIKFNLVKVEDGTFDKMDKEATEGEVQSTDNNNSCQSTSSQSISGASLDEESKSKLSNTGNDDKIDNAGGSSPDAKSSDRESKKDSNSPTSAHEANSPVLQSKVAQLDDSLVDIQDTENEDTKMEDKEITPIIADSGPSPTDNIKFPPNDDN